MNSHLIFITQGTLWLWWCSQCSNSLQAGRSGHRIPRGVRLRVSVPVQTIAGVHPASYTFQGVKWPRYGI